jgi:hypothetical protein
VAERAASEAADEGSSPSPGPVGSAFFEGDAVPFADKEKQREYARRWLAARRAAWFAGKCCAFCGSVNNLELDHIDPAKKVAHRIWSWSAARREAELAKCRSLCDRCHKERSNAQVRKPMTHGTITAYTDYGCRCDLCRAVNAERSARRRRRVSVLKRSGR